MKYSFSVLINSIDVGKYIAQAAKANMSFFLEEIQFSSNTELTVVFKSLLSLILSCHLTLGAIPETCNC